MAGVFTKERLLSTPQRFSLSLTQVFSTNCTAKLSLLQNH